MINSPSSQAGGGGGGGAGTTPGGAAGGSGGNTTGASSGHVQFRMTVKLDIEGHVPSTSSTPTSSTTTTTTTTLASQSTQDLLLKLQPLLPHLCISKDSATMLSTPSTVAEHLPLQLEPPAPTTCDDTGLELSLGLSMFKKSGTVDATDTAGTTSGNANNTVVCQPEVSESGSFIWKEMSSSRGAGGGGGGSGDAFTEGSGGEEKPVLQRQVSNAGGAAAAAAAMVRSESSLPLDWRALEEQRVKREAQFQRRQEARKKRRILIDEQKIQRKAAAAAAAARGVASSSSPTTLIKQPSSRSTLGCETNLPADEQKPYPNHDFKDEKVGGVAIDESSTRKNNNNNKSGACRSNSRGRKRVKHQPDSSTVTSAIKVKSEAEESLTPLTSVNSGVIRPSPVHEPSQEWVQKFLEMQSMVSKSTTPKSDVEEQQVLQLQVEGDEEQESLSQRKKLKRMESLPGMTRQGSLNLKRISSPPPVPPYRDSAMDSQCSSVCSSMPLATGLFSPPSTYSTLSVPNKAAVQVAQVATTRSVDPVPALLRSVSLGAFRCNNNNEQQLQQQPHMIQMPSPVRSSSNNALLLRTLSDGAVMRAIARAVETEQGGSLVNRNSRSSAFKSPKREAQVSSVTSGTSGETMVRPGVRSEEAELPLVSTRGTGPNGKLVNGVLLAYRKGDVKIICACHGQHMTAKEFVEHAGGVDVANPEKCIVVSPSKRARRNDSMI